MALPKFEKDISYISKLADQPNDTAGGELSAAQLKARFDAAGNDLKAYINDVLIPAIANDIAAAAEGISGGSQIGEDKIADGAVTSGKIAALAVLTSAIADLAVTNAKIADGAVGETKIADGAVTNLKIAQGAVARDKIADEAVSTNKIYPGAVTNQKLGDASVGESKIIDDAVSASYKSILTKSGWESFGDFYRQTASLSSLKEKYRMIVDVERSGLGSDELQEICDAWGAVCNVEISDGTAAFYSFEVPTVDIPIKMAVIKK